MFRTYFTLSLVTLLVGLDAMEVAAQRRGGGRRGGGRSGASRSISRPRPSSSMPRPQYRGQPSSGRSINRSNLPSNINRGNINRGNLPSNINRGNVPSNINRGNLPGNINRGNLPSSINRGSSRPSNSNRGNLPSGTNRGNLNRGNLSGGTNRSGSASGLKSIENFLNSSSRSKTTGSSGRPSTLPSTGTGWNSKTFETARGGKITVGRGAGSKTGPGGGQVGGAGRGVKIETAGGKTVSKGSLVAGGKSASGNAAVGGITGGRASDGRGNAVGGARGGAVNNRGDFRRGSVTGRKNDWGYAQVTGRGISGNLNTGSRTAATRSAVRGPWGNVITTGRGARFVNGQFVGGRTWTTINGNFVRWNAFGPRWWVRYPNYWWPGRWVAGTVWWVATWNNAAQFCDINDPGIYYDYGQNVTFDDENVYYENAKVSSTEDFYDSANAIAEAGLESKNDEWMPLGVFAYVKNPEETETERIIQLALNKDRAIRGNLRDLLTDKVIPVYGSADKDNQRVALKMEGNDTVILEVGLYNLTNDEVPVLIHFSRDKRQDAMLIRLKNPEEKQPQEKE